MVSTIDNGSYVGEGFYNISWEKNVLRRHYSKYQHSRELMLVVNDRFMETSVNLPKICDNVIK